MVKAIIAGKPMAEVLDLAGHLRASRGQLFEALQPEGHIANNGFLEMPARYPILNVPFDVQLMYCRIPVLLPRHI